jgi:hypothetical protein
MRVCVCLCVRCLDVRKVVCVYACVFDVSMFVRLVALGGIVGL